MADQERTERESVAPVAYVLHAIELREDVNRDDFETLMLKDVFPALDTSAEGEAPDQHFLLGSELTGDPYLWMSRLEYWVHQTPLPNWLYNRVERQAQEAGEKLAAYGTIVESKVYYDVTGWRARLGK